MTLDYKGTNQAAWDRLAEGGSLFARAATDEECDNPLRALDGRGWLPASVDGLDVLCLASGGGWQSILYAVAGANVTVVDISESMLVLDRKEAEKRGVSVRTLQGSMDDLRALDNETFDIVHQPVSSCYIPDLVPMFAEIARVLRDDGVYISQHKQPTSLQISHRNERHQFVIGVEYYHKGPLPRQVDKAYRETGAVEYLHRLDDLIGNLCRSNMVVEDFREPVRANYKVNVEHFGYRGRYVPPYLRLKARRKHRDRSAAADSSTIWTP